MKILFIARRYPPSVGGMERFAFDLANALNESNEVKRITWGGENKWLPLVLPWFFLRGFWYLLNNSDTKIIHIQDAVQAPIGWLLHVIFKKPYVVVAHGLDITYEKFLYQQTILPFVRKASAVISISTATSEEVLRRKIVISKVHIITLGTHDDYGKLSPNKDELAKKIKIDLADRVILLTTGRLVRRKGVAWFVKNVLPEIVKEYKNILYLVAGDGTEREVINQSIKDAGVEDHVAMLGRVSKEVMNALYQSSDIFVMPNIVVPGDMEGFGIVVHEAATAGLPVVASKLEGIADALVDGENGMLVESADVGQFVKKITELAGDKEFRMRFGKKARNYTLSEYSWEKIAKEYLAVYKTL